MCYSRFISTVQYSIQLFNVMVQFFCGHGPLCLGQHVYIQLGLSALCKLLLCKLTVSDNVILDVDFNQMTVSEALMYV